MVDPLRAHLEALVAAIDGSFEAANQAREVALPKCRRVIRLSGSAIKYAHRREQVSAEAACAQAESELRGAQDALADWPDIEHAGFLHDAEKEYVEARSVLAMIAGVPVPSPTELRVGDAAWLRGVAEAASELRRHLLDRLRDGDLEHAQRLFRMMEDSYDALIEIDHPDAITHGLRRTLDGLRAVIERSRSDLTTTTLGVRLQASIESAGRGRV